MENRLHTGEMMLECAKRLDRALTDARVDHYVRIYHSDQTGIRAYVATATALSDDQRALLRLCTGIIMGREALVQFSRRKVAA